ncbi:MAG: efflux RND transporter periplasmic adaptor subunit [Bdellovibrionota bacterium]
MKRLGRNIILAVVVCVAIFGISRLLRTKGTEGHQWRTAQVAYGDLDVTITATGTVEPEELVDVGAQVAGKINSFGKNKLGQVADYGVEVDEGDILAQIDDSLYAADVLQAKASVNRSKADLAQLRAKLQQAENDWKRAQAVGPSDALSATQFDAFRAAYDVAKASVAVGEATLEQTQSSLGRAEQNLGYTTIHSPVRGVIIDRRVNIGQTVVASLNAPSLFLIAKDLRRMQVWVAVNEADIGSIRPGQTASFTVDAFPGKTFKGEVRKIRLNAAMTQNVVTYTVEVQTDNSSGELLPYLTANLKFDVTHREHVLLVPSAALRWSPPADVEALRPGKKDSGKGELPDDQRLAPRESQDQKTVRGTLWTPDGDQVRAVRVRVAATDGAVTEVSGEEVTEGLTVIVGEEAPVEVARSTGSASGTTNPFAPTIMRGRRR